MYGGNTKKTTKETEDSEITYTTIQMDRHTYFEREDDDEIRYHEDVSSENERRGKNDDSDEEIVTSHNEVSARYDHHYEREHDRKQPPNKTQHPENVVSTVIGNYRRDSFTGEKRKGKRLHSDDRVDVENTYNCDGSSFESSGRRSNNDRISKNDKMMRDKKENIDRREKDQSLSSISNDNNQRHQQRSKELHRKGFGVAWIHNHEDSNDNHPKDRLLANDKDLELNDSVSQEKRETEEIQSSVFESQPTNFQQSERSDVYNGAADSTYPNRYQAIESKLELLLNKPKRPFSGYNLFFRVERDRIIDCNRNPHYQKPYTHEEVGKVAMELKTSSKGQGGSGRRSSIDGSENGDSEGAGDAGNAGIFAYGDLARRVGERWKHLSTEDRAIFEEYASLERQKFNYLMHHWKQRLQILEAEEERQVQLHQYYFHQQQMLEQEQLLQQQQQPKRKRGRPRKIKVESDLENIQQPVGTADSFVSVDTMIDNSQSGMKRPFVPSSFYEMLMLEYRRRQITKLRVEQARMIDGNYPSLDNNNNNYNSTDETKPPLTPEQRQQIITILQQRQMQQLQSQSHVQNNLRAVEAVISSSANSAENDSV